MEQENSGHEHIKFAASINADRDHFFRRACPSCGREFKTQLDPADLQWALEVQCRRMGLDIGEHDGHEAPSDRLRCPFCDHEDVSSEMHTDETVEYLKRLIY